jgi:GTP cyclohydrolase II
MLGRNSPAGKGIVTNMKVSFQHEVTPFESSYGKSRFHCFTFGTHEEDNYLALECGDYKKSGLVRIQSACYTAEIFRSLDCDCHQQLDQSLDLIHRDGGLLIYMLCDGRGAGLAVKTKALKLWAEQGIDTHDAYQQLGKSLDPRDYGRVIEVLRWFSVRECRLLTNNPRKFDALSLAGFKVERAPLEVPVTSSMLPYLETKKRKLGHLFSDLKTTPAKTKTVRRK